MTNRPADRPSLAERLEPARVIARSGLAGPLRPDKYLKMGAVAKKYGATALVGVSLAAQRRPGGIAIVDERGALTWGELDERSDALAVALSAKVKGGSGRIGLLARNHRGFVEALVASGKLGADLVLLNTAFAGPQLREVLEREQVDVIVYDQEYAEHLADFDSADHVVAWVDDPETVRGEASTVDALIATHLGTDPGESDDTPHVILLTSGTTGTPKGAKRGAGGGAGDLVAAIERVPWRAEDTIMVAAPMFHAWGFGCLVLASTLANTIVMRRHFDAEETLRLAAQHRAGGMGVVPVMIDRIMSLPEHVRARYPLPALRYVTASGSAMEPSSLTRFMNTYGDVVYSHYNATEAGMIATATPDDLRANPRSAGKAVRGCELRILDDQNRELPAGEVGQIAVLNSTPFDGYTHGGGKDSADGYMLTGDLGRLDSEGRLTVEGRVDDMIVSGGENVYPIEVEAVLSGHDEVAEAAVIGVDDAKFGQRLAAFVALAPGSSIGPDDLRAYVREQLANYKVPREITVLDALPRNASGKVVKRDLPVSG